MPIDTLFVVEPATGLSVRARELLQSRARSHASRHTHKKSQYLRNSAKTDTDAQPTQTLAQKTRKYAHQKTAQSKDPTENSLISNSTNSHVKASAEHSDSQAFANFGIIDSKINDQRPESTSQEVHDNASSNRNSCTIRLPKQAYEKTRGLEVGDNLPKALFPSAMKLSSEENNILRYFTTTWFPSTTHIPPGCHISGYAPLHPKDALLSAELVAEAAQGPSELHIYALLTMTVCRMQFVHHIFLHDDCAREKYYGLAIRALRKFLASNHPVPPRIIFDVSLLALSEGYVPEPSRSKVYSQMLCSFVRSCGGLANISEFIGTFCVATDFLMAATTLTLPAFDFYACPELLGLKMEGKEDIREAITSTLADLNPRLRISCETLTTLLEVTRAIHYREGFNPPRATEYVKMQNRLAYRTLTAPSAPRHDDVTASIHHQQALTADCLFHRARLLGFSVWLWHVSTSFLEEENTCSFDVSGLISRVCTSLRCAVDMFHGTLWQANDRCVLWISALGILTSRQPPDIIAFAKIYEQALLRLRITDDFELARVFADHLPLECVNRNWFQQLSTVLVHIDDSSGDFYDISG